MSGIYVRFPVNIIPRPWFDDPQPWSHGWPAAHPLMAPPPPPPLDPAFEKFIRSVTKFREIGGSPVAYQENSRGDWYGGKKPKAKRK